MIINFKAHEINRGVHKLTQILKLIKKICMNVVFPFEDSNMTSNSIINNNLRFSISQFVKSITGRRFPLITGHCKPACRAALLL